MQDKNLLKISISVVVLVLLLFQIIAAMSFEVRPARAVTKTIMVPDNFSSISAAICNASAGDTIIVRTGDYFENPVIDKPLSLMSETPGGAVVVGAGGLERGANPVFILAAESIELSGFTIKSQNYSSATFFATGIKVAGDNCSVSHNTIVGTYYGVFISLQSFTKVVNNNITVTRKDAVRICGGFQNIVSGNVISKNAQSGVAIDGYSDVVSRNDVTGNTRGVGLGASYSVVFGNNFTDNSESGIYVGASNSIIKSNNIARNRWGVYFTSYFAAPNNNTLYENNFLNNTQNVGASSAYNIQCWNKDHEGNYWSDYIAKDDNGDRIGDLPYNALLGNVDNYPLVTPYVLSSGALEPDFPHTPTGFNGTLGMWHFDEILANGVTPDSLNVNPAMLEPTGQNFTPELVTGKHGNALRFNGTNFVYLASSPTLSIHGEVTFDAWINVQQYKNVAYNNIFVECVRTQDRFPTRIFGFAINGQAPENSSSPPMGALRGFFLDDKGIFNEIVTTQSVVPLNDWVHVSFVRSLADGMHIYVNETEENVQVTSGSQNPTGSMAPGSEYYFGHDSISTLDEVSVSNVAAKFGDKNTTSYPWWLWIIIIAGIVALIGGVFLLRRKSS